MLRARRDELLNHTYFSGPTEPGGNNGLQVVETWKYTGVDRVQDQKNFRHQSLRDEEVESWLSAEGFWEPPKPPGHDAVLEGSIRLLFCERVSYRPPGFGLSREAYLAIERGLNLPVNTLDAAFNYQGTFSKQFRHGSNRTLESIGLVLKAAQKMPIANYLLALSHNISTGITTAFIHGAFLHVTLPTIKSSLYEAPIDYSAERRHRDYHQLQLPTRDERATQSARIVSYLRSSLSQWNNPMLLPMILLENYMMRSDLFAHDLGDQIVGLERQTGVVFAGRTVNSHELAIEPEQIPKGGIRKLTQDMHTLLAEIIYYERCVEWSLDCTGFLENCTRELSKSTLPDDKKYLKNETQEVLETIEYLAASAKSMCGFQRALKERVHSQIGVLYSFTAQIDNSINAKIAVSSARDSSAMKTLALITTIFLPGTFVATLFSMSMFDWATQSGEADTVSKKFWIYWAVTIPLTLLTMIVWRIWWLWQERLYEKEVNEAVGEVKDEGARPSERRMHGHSIVEVTTEPRRRSHGWRKNDEEPAMEAPKEVPWPRQVPFGTQLTQRSHLFAEAHST